ncbi:MAG: substrate-binding domain-containing protein [Alphaproteobacteria bacterium]|nr:substrate-binding domain-containing protein [Alphaproteobacteria bacterium]
MAGAAMAVLASPAVAREIKVKGSSTVLPYAEIVAENFQKSTQYKVTVEGGGSSAGLKDFCLGLGEDKIDIANASRQIKKAEVETCAKNGVSDIIEVQFGYDGIVFASDVKGPAIALEPKDVFLAIAETVAYNGVPVPNEAKTLKDVNAAFPAWPIKFFIPGEKHGTREVFEEKVVIPGCKASGTLEAYVKAGKDEKAAEAACKKFNKDFAVDIDGDYTETLARLDSNKKSIGVFGLAFYESNTDKLRVATVSGVTPTGATVASGEYPVSRPLFFYIKKAHLPVIPGLKEYAEFFVSEDMIGPGGPLETKGLVPAPDAEREAVRATVSDETTLK